MLTHIFPTLGGGCTDPNTGAVNEEMLRNNLNLAIAAYISRVDGCPCGDTNIRLYRGADTSEHLKLETRCLPIKGVQTCKGCTANRTS